MVVAAIISSSWEVIKPVVSCEPTILTSTRTYEPACNVAPVVPTAFLLKIFSTAVSPWFLIEISLDPANTGDNFFSNVLAAKACSFLPNTIA